MPVVHIVDVVDGAVRSLTVDRVVSHTNINTEPLVGAGSVSAEDRLPIHDRLQDPLQDLDIRYELDPVWWTQETGIREMSIKEVQACRERIDHTHLSFVPRPFISCVRAANP